MPLVRLPLVEGGEVAVRPQDVVMVRSVVVDGKERAGQCHVIFENDREHVALSVEEAVKALIFHTLIPPRVV